MAAVSLTEGEQGHRTSATAEQRPVGVWLKVRPWTALAAQVSAIAAIGAYSLPDVLPHALPSAFAGLSAAVLMMLWSGKVWDLAPLAMQWAYGLLGLAGSALSLWLVAFHPSAAAGLSLPLALAALPGLHGPLAFTLFGSAPQDLPDESRAKVAAARLVGPVWFAGAHIAMIVAAALFSVNENPREAHVFFAVALVMFASMPLTGILRARVVGEATMAFCDNRTQFGLIGAAFVLFSTLAVLCALRPVELADGTGAFVTLAILLIALLVAVGITVLFCWRQAIEDQRFPVRNRHAPFDHIDSWAVVLFAAAVGGIVFIALWAATSQAMTDGINANWGLGTTAIVAAMFIAFAFAPQIELPPGGAVWLKKLSEWLKPIGSFFSWIDGVLAIPIACAQGANLDRWWQRYLMLVMAIVPCGVLGYWLPAPFGLLPICWGFIITIAISRRWAWVEDDRELAMLTRNFSSSALRIGFRQDLRDEALLSFMSMFILVPLALRQSDMWAMQMGAMLFTLREGAPNDLQTWTAFYGSELAKAVPFVDWAETYSVEGQTSVEFKDSIWAKHLVFMTRILVDLVFLGALLQAIAISGRISRQREMFFGKDRSRHEYRHGNPDGKRGELTMLDPFIEAKEFKKLRNAAGGVDFGMVRAFPTYDPARLIALSSDHDDDIKLAAIALKQYQQTDNPELLRNLYATLDETIFPKAGRIDKDRVKEVVSALKAAGGSPDVLALRIARGQLNHKPWATYIRRDIMEMIAAANPEMTENPETERTERRDALIWCLVGDTSGERTEIPEQRSRDAHRDVREVALAALIEMAPDPQAVDAITTCAASDPAIALRRRSKEFLAKL